MEAEMGTNGLAKGTTLHSTDRGSLGPMFHYLQNLSPDDDQYFDDLYHSEKSSSFLISTISDYDLGGEGDLFKAPEPIIEPLVTLDHMTSSMSMITCGEEVISHESLQSDYFTSNLLYGYEDILADETSTTPSEVLNFELPTTKDYMEENLHPPEKITKSASSISLSSVDRAQIRPNCMNFDETELKKVHCMRRVFSEGYIKPQLIDHNNETRMQKLSRYRDKKTKRNFGRKIKYACRKVLADGQPRIRGRFAKMEEIDILTRK